MKEALHLVALIDRLSRLSSGIAFELGLNPAQLEALSYLSRANRFSRTPGAVTAYLTATSGTVSQTIIALEKKGFVHKVAHPRDKRTRNIEPTAKGIELLEAHQGNVLMRALADIPDNDRGEPKSRLEAVLRSSLLATSGRPFGLCRRCRHFQRGHADGTPNYCALLAEPLSHSDAELICAEQQPV
jgi:DNA-binding MarR family transcriptional regulator